MNGSYVPTAWGSVAREPVICQAASGSPEPGGGGCGSPHAGPVTTCLAAGERDLRNPMPEVMVPRGGVALRAGLALLRRLTRIPS